MRVDKVLLSLDFLDLPYISIYNNHINCLCYYSNLLLLPMGYRDGSGERQ